MPRFPFVNHPSLDFARYYKSIGWPVFPLSPRKKTPATQHGFHDASLDDAQIEQWWGGDRAAQRDRLAELGHEEAPRAGLEQGGSHPRQTQAVAVRLDHGGAGHAVQLVAEAPVVVRQRAQVDGQDGAGLGIFGDIGPKVGCADFTEDGFVDSRDYCVLADEWLKDQNPLTADLIDDNKIDGQDLAGFCEQWLRPCYECSEVDINNDGRIDFRDYGFWADNWSKEGPGLIGDFTANGSVNFEDLRAFLFHWAKNCN